MILQDPRVQKIIKALSNKRIKVSHLLKCEAFKKNVERKALRMFINRKPEDTRTRDEIYWDTYRGELCEYGIFEECVRELVEVFQNEEEITDEFFWDLLIEMLRVEIKSQKSNKTYFSLMSENSFMRDNWDKFDLIIACCVEYEGKEDAFIIPWMIIDAVALNPELPFYIPSNFKGYYLTIPGAKKYAIDLLKEEKPLNTNISKLCTF